VVHQVSGGLLPPSRGPLPRCCPGLPCGSWVSLGVRFRLLPLDSPPLHGRTTSPAKSCAPWFLPPPHSQLHSRCCWLASGGVTIEISPHPSMRGGVGRKRGVIRYEHGRWWWGEFRGKRAVTAVDIPAVTLVTTVGGFNLNSRAARSKI